MIPGFPSIGGGEIIILLVIILLFFGAKRIPELARSLGRGTREFRQGISEVTSDEKAPDDQETDQEKAPPKAVGDGQAPRAESEESTTAEHKT